MLTRQLTEIGGLEIEGVDLSSPLSANTSATAGVRYQIFRSDLSSNYTEAAAFVGVNHTFR